MILRNTIFSIFIWVVIQSVAWADSPNATILLYHGLTENCPEDMYQKRKDRFINDMMYIKENFDVISLFELQDIMENQKTLPRKTVVITFDDGLLSDYAIAAPILKEFGFPATFFIVTNWRDDPDYMNWEQIKELSQVQKEGKYLFTIGSHAHTHRFPGLQDLTGTALRHELEESKRLIDQHIAPLTCTTFAVPYGRLPQDQNEFRNLATELGYKIIRTSASRNINLATDQLLNLPCLPLYDFTEPDYIGAYNLNPLPTPFFEPVQDIYLAKNIFTTQAKITELVLYDLPSGNNGITIEAVSENNELIKNLKVNYFPPDEEATILIEINEGKHGSAKINLTVSAQGAHPSSGYFYVHVESELSAHVTILLYHGLTENCPEDMYQKRKDRFINDMMYIKENFDVISLLDMQDIIENKKTLERNAVVITFDDGLRSDYTIAAPILKEFGFPATFFIVTNWRNDPDYMNWEQIKELSKITKDGKYLFTIGSHSHTHRFPGLQDLTGTALRHELEESKRLIDQHIAPLTCTTFAVPYGRLPQDQNEFRNLATELGYKIIRTSETRNINIATDHLLNLPCLPLYDFTEPGYIGAYNQNPLPTPFFEPVQDIFLAKNIYTTQAEITEINLYAPSGNNGIAIEAVSENNELIKSLRVNYFPPEEEATIHIEINEGKHGSAKINLKVSAPGAYHSSGYFFVNVESVLSAISQEYSPNNKYIFPNPATDRIEIKNMDETDVYKMYNVAGSLVLTGRGNKIDISAFPKGVYFLAIYSGNEITTALKFLKNQ